MGPESIADTRNAGAFERLLRLFPGLLAGGLALVYVLGALATGSEFTGAGIDARDAVPLLSIEQLLARGIGVVVDPSTIWSLAGVLIIIGSVILFQGFVAHHSVNRKMATAGMTGFALGIGASLFALAPVNQLPGAVVMAVGVFAVVLISQLPATSSSEKWRPLLPVLALLAVVVGLGVDAYIDPSPLAEVRLDLSSRYEEARGTFITHSDSTWYLFDHGRDEIEAFPDESVEAAFIEERVSGTDGKTLLEYVW